MTLPEKSYFTLAEVLERWKNHGCPDRASLLEYARADQLVFCVYFRESGSYRTRTDIPEGTLVREVTAMVFHSEAHEELGPLRYLRSDDARRILEAPPGVEIAVNGWFTRVERTRGSGIGYPQHPKYLTADDLLVSREERDRFEALHNLNLAPASSAQDHALETLLGICRRVPKVIRLCKERWGNRGKQFDVADEYDLQDLMQGLLAANFEDVRSEDYVPSCAARNSRIDFFLAAEEIGVELKMTRDGLREREVAEQLIVDIRRYRAHPGCKTLVFLVYDPVRAITNPAALEKDLSGPEHGVHVYVLVVT